MQRLDRIRQAPLWQSLFVFDKGKITTEVAIRSSVGIVIPLILGAVFARPGVGALGALGALNVASSDSRDPYKTRGRRILVASLLVGAAVSIGSLSAYSGVTAFLAVTLWAFAAGMMVVLGTRAGDLGVTTLVTLVVFAARPMPAKIALESGLVAVCGGVLQAILSVAVWPLGRYRPERRFISSLYATLSHLAISPAGPDGPPPGDDKIAQTQDALSSLAQDHTPEGERYVFLLSQAERVRLSLLTLRRLHRRITRDPEGGAAADDIEKILSDASDSLQSVSVNALKGLPGVESRDLTEAARTFREKHASSSVPVLNGMLRDACDEIDSLAGQIRSACRLTAETIPRDPRVPWRLRFTGWSARILANLSFESSAFRHAIRLAVCVGVGDTAGRMISLQRTYWLPMTIALVLRPDFNATFSRGILRVAGTFLGLLVATGLFHFLRANTWEEIVLLTLFAFLMRSIGLANYGIFVTALSALVVLLLAIGGVSPKDVIATRAVNTAIGGLVALLAYGLWPTWERTQAGPVFADLIEDYRAYFNAVVKAYRGEGDGDLDRTRSKARVARANAEALVARIATEPGVSSERANLLNAALVSLHGFARAVMALESALYRPQPERAEPAAVDFASKVDQTLRAFVEALRVSQSPRGDLPNLREAHNLFEDSYNLVGVETDRIVTSLNTLREQVERLFGASVSSPSASRLHGLQPEPPPSPSVAGA